MSAVESLTVDLVCQGLPLDEAEHRAYVQVYGYDPRVSAEVCDE